MSKEKFQNTPTSRLVTSLRERTNLRFKLEKEQQSLLKDRHAISLRLRDIEDQLSLVNSSSDVLPYEKEIIRRIREGEAEAT